VSYMRVFTVSDIHVDFDGNARWIAGLPTQDYRDVRPVALT
jgi:hypothetical protein